LWWYHRNKIRAVRDGIVTDYVSCLVGHVAVFGLSLLAL
jgi:hypothetical protein